MLPGLGALALGLACNGDDMGTSATDASATGTTTATATSGSTSGANTSATTSESATQGSESATEGSGSTTGATSTTDPTATATATMGSTSNPETGSGSASDTSDSTGVMGCGICNQPNQQCIDDVCVTSCQGQDPDPCGPDQVCDVISGECKAADDPCTLGGGSEPCGDAVCGPGSVCDGLGECVPIAPCAAVACTDDKACWGALCSCTRQIDCTEPTAELLNGPFSTDIGGLDFADDCNAWMVTLRSGTDYVRKLTPEGVVTTWAGVANLNMGEVRVLKRLTVPQSLKPLTDIAAGEVTPPKPVEGLGEVAITYTCCPSCGCFVDPPQGVARLNEDDMQNPLPIIIAAKPTQGTGPFGSTAADAGPHGLTWGEDRVLYVGNSTNNGDLNTADLDQMTQELLTTFDSRVTAGAPVSPAHILVALIGGEVYRYNTNTGDTELVVDLMADVTSLSHDSFTGLVYAGLSTLEIVELNPFTGDVSTFGMMPGKGRVAVSPSGQLWFSPVKYIYNGPLTSWPLPDAF